MTKCSSPVRKPCLCWRLALEQAEYLSELVDAAEGLAHALLAMQDLPRVATDAGDEPAVAKFADLCAPAEAVLEPLWEAVYQRRVALEHASDERNPSEQEIEESHVCAVLERYTRMQELLRVLRGGAAQFRARQAEIRHLPLSEQAAAWQAWGAERVAPSVEVAAALSKERDRLWDRARRHAHREPPAEGNVND